tara:strand:+ start:304 stop:459 length:156 start_codon:yes stop_codon:yes gene_type:complete
MVSKSQNHSDVQITEAFRCSARTHVEKLTAKTKAKKEKEQDKTFVVERKGI